MTTLFLTTALFNAVAREVPDAFRHLPLRCCSAARRSSRAGCATCCAPDRPRRLLHVYGPTEATTFATWHEVRAEVAERRDTIPIGRPIANTEVFVLRADCEPAAPGEPGEICIGGPGLALGYLGPPELTAERFVDARSRRSRRGALYRTGDRARWRDDGDDRVPRPRRPAGQDPRPPHRARRDRGRARAPAAGARGGGAGARRRPATRARSSRSSSAPTRRRRRRRTCGASCAATLPDYMLPGAIVWLPALPLNANGKVDRRALPAPGDTARAARRACAVPPRDMFEQRARPHLGGAARTSRSIGVFDHFFEIGGHSLLAARLVDAIERETGLAVPLTALFADDTIAGLARVLRDGAPRRDAPIVAINGDGTRPPFVFLHGDFTGGRLLQPRARARARTRPADADRASARPRRRRRSPRRSRRWPPTASARCAMRPHGPYVLGGHCNGALVAFEMARQLLDQGESVPAVVMIEARAPCGGARTNSGERGAYVTIDAAGGARDARAARPPVRRGVALFAGDRPVRRPVRAPAMS